MQASALDACRHKCRPGTPFGAPHSSPEVETQMRTFTSVAEGGHQAGRLGECPVEERFRWLTAVKSSCLQTSRPHPGLTRNLDSEFDRLFALLVL